MYNDTKYHYETEVKMAWVATNFNGTEIISPDKPTRDFREWSDYQEIWIEGEYGKVDYSICLPKGTIRKLIGKELTWEDDPVELI